MSDLKKVLIITYYWPPSGGAGVQRWLKFVKYLREFGFEPIVYTPSNPEMPVEDSSLKQDIPTGITILQQPIWEPYHWYKKWVGVKPTEKINTGFLSESDKPKKTESIGVWVRGNFFIPDARCFWIQPSIKFLSQYLQENKVDIIVSTGPPHSMHMIAKGVSKALNIPWVADFRDPWTNIDFYDQLMLTRWADKKHHKLELQVIQEADFVTTVTQEDADDFTKKGAQNTRCITNGYDDEFHSVIAIDSHFTLVHVGSIPPARNHEILWKVIQKLSLELPGFSEHFKLKLIGKTDIGVRKSIQKYHLEKYCELIEYIPHAKAIEMQQSAQMLLLLVNNSGNAKSILTGKFFEYLAAQRPIIAIGPTDGEMNRILQDSQAGACADFEDAKALENILIENFKKFLSQSPLTISSNGIEKYSRRSLTHEMSKVFEQILNNHEKQKN